MFQSEVRHVGEPLSADCTSIVTWTRFRQSSQCIGPNSRNSAHHRGFPDGFFYTPCAIPGRRRQLNCMITCHLPSVALLGEVRWIAKGCEASSKGLDTCPRRSLQLKPWGMCTRNCLEYGNTHTQPQRVAITPSTALFLCGITAPHHTLREPRGPSAQFQNDKALWHCKSVAQPIIR